MSQQNMTSPSVASSEKNPYNYCLKWSNYQSHVANVLVQLLHSETMVDVTLCASGGEKVCAHRIVLCAASSYFQEILADTEDSHPVVILSEVTPEDLHCILEFVYHGELNVEASQLTSVLQVAAALQIRGLMEVSDQLPTLVPVDKTSKLPGGEPLNRQSTESAGSASGNGLVETTNSTSKGMGHEKGTHDSYCCEPVTQSIIANEIVAGHPTAPVPQLSQEYMYPPMSGSLPTENQIESHLSSGQPVVSIKSEGSGLSQTIHIHYDTQDNRRLKQQEHCRKKYSEEQLSAALNDLSTGHVLVETAAAHHIPRSTLYARAKSAGITLSVARQEHSGDRVHAAVQAVNNGCSLQQASLLYQIPKTVLWRRVKAAGGREGWSSRRNYSYGLENRQAAIQALQNGQNITKVSAQYQIPKTTLFREKTRLMEAGKLPWSCVKRRESQSCALKHSRIKEAVAACREGRMSQAVASATYQVPKTTIWRRLKKEENLRSGGDSGKVQSVQIGNAVTDTRVHHDHPQYSLCESRQLPMSYIVSETDFTDTSLIM